MYTTRRHIHHAASWASILLISLPLLVFLGGTSIAEVLLVDHTAVAKFDDIPDEWIDKVRTLLVHYVGASHGRQLPYGLEMLEAMDPKYSVQLDEDLANLTQTGSLRVLRAQRSEYNDWIGSISDEKYWATPDGKDWTIRTIQHALAQQDTIALSLWCWSWHMVFDWTEDEDGVTGLFDDLRRDNYLAALAGFNGDPGLAPTVFAYSTTVTDAGVDENGWRTTRYNDDFRAMVPDTAVFFDQGDIENWNYDDTQQRIESWDGHDLYLRHHDYDAEIPPDNNPAEDHANDLIGLRKAKAFWWMLARLSGWDGNPASDTTPPSIPQNLAGEPLSQVSIHLSWSPATDETAIGGYSISRDGIEIDTCADTTYTDTGLEDEHAYTYTVRAYDTALNYSDFSSGCIVATLPYYYTLTGSALHGSIEFAPDEPVYANGTSVKITAYADEGYAFDHWSGDLTGTYNPALLTVDGNKQVTANFIPGDPDYILKLPCNNNLDDKSIHGLDGTWIGEQAYAEGIVNRAALFDSTTGNYFKIPHDAAMGGMAQVTVSAWAKKNDPDIGNIIVNKHRQYSITIGAENIEAYITNDADVIARVSANHLSAIHDTQWHHYAVSYDGAAVTLFVDDVLVAMTPLTGLVNTVSSYDLHVGKNPWGGTFPGCIDELSIQPTDYSSGQFSTSLTIHAENGSVSRIPDKVAYMNGEEVELTAHPDPGYMFTHWEDDLTQTDNPVIVVMDADKVITAVFDRPYIINMGFDGETDNAVPNGLTGIWHNTPRYGDGIVQECLSLDNALNNYVTVAANDLLGGMSMLSVSVWARKTDPDIGGYLVNKHIQYSVSIGDNDISAYVTNQNGDVARISTGTLEAIHDADWHHYLLVYDGATAALYVDGLMIGEKPLTGPVNANTAMALHIGKNPWGPNFHGMIDELRITAEATMPDSYTRTLTVSADNGDVMKEPDQSSYALGEEVMLTAVPDDGFVFDRWEGADTSDVNPLPLIMDTDKNVTALFKTAYVLKMHFDGDLTDETHNLPDGTWYGVPSFAPGIVGSCIDIDPVDNNYVVVTTSPLLGGMEKLTLSVWAKKNDGATGGTLIQKHLQYSLVIGGQNLSCYIQNSAGELAELSVNGVSAMNDTLWHNYLVGYDGMTMKLFVDGIPVGEKAFTGIVREESGHNLYIGKNRWGTAFNGRIDELIIAEKTPETDGFTYTLDVSAVNGTVDIEPHKTVYAPGEEVILTPLPAPGYVFGDWTGDLESTSSPLVIIMNADLALQANFETAYLLKMYFDGTTLDASANHFDGVWYGDPSYAPGVSNLGLAITPQDDNYVVVEHDDLLCGMSHLSISLWAKKDDPDIGGMLLNKHLNYSITIGGNYLSAYITNSEPVAGSVNVYGLDMIHDTAWHSYALSYDGAMVRLFVDDVVVGQAPLTGTVRTDRANDIYIGKNPWGAAFKGRIDELFILENEFTSPSYLYTLTTVSDNGTIERSPDKTLYLNDEEVLLSAIPADGFVFSHWTGDLEGADNPAIITMDGNKAVTAVFIENISSTILSLHLDGTVDDSSFNDFDGAWYGVPAYAPGIAGQAIDTSPVNDNYVVVPNNELFGGMDCVTVSLWARKNDPDVGGSILNSHLQYAITVGDDYITSYVSNIAHEAGRVNVYSLDAVHDSAWHAYALCFTGTMVRLYLDGELLGETPFTGPVRYSPTNDIYIGKNPWGDAFDGCIDEVHITTDEYDGGDFQPPAAKPAASVIPEPFVSNSYPNPFNASTHIDMHIPGLKGAAGTVPVSVVMYTAYGQKIRTLVTGDYSPGIYRIRWDGHDDAGALAATGLYICSVHIGTYTANTKMLFMK